MEYKIQELYKQLQRKTQECEELKKKLQNACDDCKHSYSKLKNKADSFEFKADCYKEALEQIKDIVTQINYTVAGGEKSTKKEWINLYRNIVYTVSRIINELKEGS